VATRNPINRLGDVTVLLRQVKAGDSDAVSRLLELVYPQLRRIARQRLRQERSGHTLQPTALVNEAYMQLAGQMGKDWQNRSHFYAVAAQSMRRVLVDYAREKKALKRAGDRQQVELDEALAIVSDRLDEILAIDEALQRLAAFDPRGSKVVEMRFFGGMTEEEAAEVLGVTPRTVKRDWNVAKAWLHGELRSPRAAR
jgi:RNA polymerase sigma factor (TIGR02999 family)